MVMLLMKIGALQQAMAVLLKRRLLTIYIIRLFWISNRNPNLQPEKSDNVEASLRYHNADTTLLQRYLKTTSAILIAFDSIYVYD